jgi:GPH family glycoside/pentoside/hexuronide:cation symporter
MTSEAAAFQPLPARRLAQFAAGWFPLAVANLPLAVYLPAFYAKELGLSLSTIGAVFLVTRLWDTFTDPLVGVLSDRTRSRFGRRRIWIAPGAIIFVIASTRLFFPGATVSGAYLLIWLSLLYLGLTMVQTPLLAWSGDLRAAPVDRIRIQGMLQIMSMGGTVAALALAAVLDHLGHPSLHDKMNAIGWLVLVAAALAIPAALTALKDPSSSGDRSAVERNPLKLLRLVTGDPLLVRIFASDMAVTAAITIRGVLFVLFVTAYMKLPAYVATLFLGQFVIGVAATPVWLKISARFGKRNTIISAELLHAAVATSFLLLTPGDGVLLSVLVLGQGLLLGVGNFLLRAMTADVVDARRDEGRGESHSGLVFSAFGFTTKAATAIAVGVALPLVGWLGFHPAGHNTPEALFNLKLVFALGVAGAHLVSAALISRVGRERRPSLGEAPSAAPAAGF